MNKYPEELRYTKEHEWVRKTGPTTVRVGITQHAVDQLGDITQVELPKPGESVKVGQTVASIESVKAVSDVYAPVSGTVGEVNDPLRDGPEAINEDCYDEGWLLDLTNVKADELAKLFDAAAYESYVKEQGD